MGNACVRALGRQVLPQEPQCLPQYVARRSAVVEEIKGVRAFGMVHEGDREILDKALTDEAVDGGIYPWKLVASGPGDEQRNIPPKIRNCTARAWVCETELPRSVRYVRCVVKVEEESAAEDCARRRSSGVR